MALRKAGHSLPFYYRQEPSLSRTKSGKPARFRPGRCSLVLLGLTLAISGGLVGVYFKAHVFREYWSTLRGSSAALTVQAAPTVAGGSVAISAGAVSTGTTALALEDSLPQALPWNQHLVEMTVCHDSCSKSKDGICDDGRSEDDCSDCGSWTYLLPAEDQTVPEPIAQILKHGIEIYVNRTSTLPSFVMPFTDPKKDVDVSGQMHFNRNVEIGITQVWHRQLSENCLHPNGSRSLILDVGGNFGYYSFYGASHGCRVIAWEPVPQFRAFLQYGMHLNNMSSLIEIRDKAVGERAGEKLTMKVPQRGIWGTASVDGRNIDKMIKNEGKMATTVAISERVDAVVHEDVLLIKLDVEGFEPSAFESMKGLFDGHKVDNFLMEYSPGVYELMRAWEDYPQWPKVLIYLLEQGYTLMHLPGNQSHAPLLKGAGWSGNLPAFFEITAENLKHDMEDAKKVQSRMLGCNVPAALTEQYPHSWSSCNSLPEDLDPKSFRATFGHNTNLWASINKESIQVGQPVGIQSLEQERGEWYGRDPDIGMGGRSCRDIEPENLVRHRCRCTVPEVCAAEAAIVEKLAKKGLLTPNNGAGQHLSAK